MIRQLESKVVELQENLAAELGEIEMGVLTQGYTLADAIREGCGVTDQASGWYSNDGEQACALSAAYIAIQARGLAK